jgi:serine/threonine protein kinase
VKLIKTAPVKFDKQIPISPMSKDLVMKMLDKDPEKRLDLMDMMDTDYVKMDDDDFKKYI